MNSFKNQNVPYLLKYVVCVRVCAILFVNCNRNRFHPHFFEISQEKATRKLARQEAIIQFGLVLPYVGWSSCFMIKSPLECYLRLICDGSGIFYRTVSSVIYICFFSWGSGMQGILDLWRQNGTSERASKFAQTRWCPIFQKTSPSTIKNPQHIFQLLSLIHI